MQSHEAHGQYGQWKIQKIINWGDMRKYMRNKHGK